MSITAVPQISEFAVLLFSISYNEHAKKMAQLMENLKMAHIKKVINQIFSNDVRHVFEALSIIYHVGQKFRSTSLMSQFIAIIIGQVGHDTSLQQIETAMKENSAALYHLGCTPIPGTTLARLNENQPSELYRE